MTRQGTLLIPPRRRLHAHALVFAAAVERGAFIGMFDEDLPPAIRQPGLQ